MVVTDIVLSMTSSKDASPGNTVVETVVTPIEDSSPVAPHHSVIGTAILRAAENHQTRYSNRRHRPIWHWWY